MGIQAHTDRELLDALNKFAGDTQQIFLDFDGVIVDSEPIQFSCYRQILGNYGITFGLEEFVKFLSMAEDKTWKQLIERYKLSKSPEQLSDERRGILIDALTKDSVKINWFIAPLINWANERDAPISILSADQIPVIEAVLDHFKITSAIKEIHSLHAKPKTKAELFGELITSPGSNTLLIEDSPNNLIAGIKLGMKTVGVYHSLNAEVNLGADVIVHTTN